MKEASYNGYAVRLVESLSDIDYIKQHLSQKVKVGGDTETRSLTYQPDCVAGLCMSCGLSYDKKEYAGYYIPLRHVSYQKNLPVKKVIEFFQIVLDNFSTVWWNRNFDMSMLEYDGLVVPYIGHMHDGQIMAHLAFSEAYPALKEITKKVLKWDVIDFNENNAKNNDFATTDPEVSFVYGGQDPLITTMVTMKLWNEYPYIRKIYPMDNKVLEAVRRMSGTEIYLDFKMLEEVYHEEEAKLREIQQKVFSIAGYVFNPNSARDKADALSRFVTLTKKTAKGAWKLDDETLSAIDHPLAQALVEFSHQRMYVGTFLKKMAGFNDGKPIRVNYSSVNVATGRLSSGGAGDNKFYRPINGQNIPKVEVKGFVHPDPEFGFIVDQDPHNCLDANQWVKVPDGFKKLRDVKEGDLIGTPQGWSDVTRVWNSIKPVLEFTDDRGRKLRVSAEHRIKVLRNNEEVWIPAGEVNQETDMLVVDSTWDKVC